MKKLVWVFIVLLVIGCLVGISTTRFGCISSKPQFDTIATIWNDSDSMYFVINENHDTVDWWGYSRGVEVSKKHFEKIKRIADTLLMLGYEVNSKEN